MQVNVKECSHVLDEEDVLLGFWSDRDGRIKFHYRYICGKCKWSLVGDETYCPNCGKELNWEGVRK